MHDHGLAHVIFLISASGLCVQKTNMPLSMCMAIILSSFTIYCLRVSFLQECTFAYTWYLFTEMIPYIYLMIWMWFLSPCHNLDMLMVPDSPWESE